MTKATRFQTPTPLAALWIASALLAPVARAQALPKADTILDRFVQATGGPSAYETHHSEILTGTIEFPAQGLKGTLTRYVVPGKEYSVVDLAGIGLIESGINGDVSWEKTVLLGPRIKQGAEKDQALREAFFNAPIFWRKLFPKVETAGLKTVNGEDCYEVVLTPPHGAAEHQFYSKQSGLLLKTTTVAASAMGDVDVEVDVAGYKKFGGVLMPTRSRQRAASQELTISVDDVRVNETIPDDRFALPADVSALLETPADSPAKR